MPPITLIAVFYLLWPLGICFTLWNMRVNKRFWLKTVILGLGPIVLSGLIYLLRRMFPDAFLYDYGPIVIGVIYIIMLLSLVLIIGLNIFYGIKRIVFENR